MTEAPEVFPSGEELDAAITRAKAGQLSGPEFALALQHAQLMVAVVGRDDDAGGAGDDAARPFVIDVGGTDYGVAFTSPRQWDTFTAATPFALLDGAELGRAWPAALGLAINPGSEPSILLGPADLAGLLAALRGPATIPSGTQVRIGAPDPGLPVTAVDALRSAVQADDAVRAAYELALAIGEGPIELVIGVEPQPPYSGVAEGFAERVGRLDAGFAGVAFVDLDGSMLRSAQAATAAIA